MTERQGMGKGMQTQAIVSKGKTAEKESYSWHLGHLLHIPHISSSTGIEIISSSLLRTGKEYLEFCEFQVLSSTY